jgi:hypothetical protein
VEFAPPWELLESPGSLFARLCEQTGGQLALLREAAQKAKAARASAASQ